MPELFVSTGSPYQPQCLVAEKKAERSLPLSSFIKPTERKLSRNETLFFEGDPLSWIYQIINGNLKTSKLLPDGRRQIIGFLGEGDMVGQPYRSQALFSTEAVTPATVLCYAVPQLEAAIAHSPALATWLMQEAYASSGRQLEHIISLGRKKPTERVASFLVTWHAHGAGGDRDSRTLSLPMTRIDIADYLGLTQETVCRVLAKFKSRGLIQDRQGRDVTITDIRSLEYVAEAGLMN